MVIGIADRLAQIIAANPKEIRHPELRVLLVLLFHADWESGESRPGRALIAERAHVREDDCRKILRSLEEKGFIRKVAAHTNRRAATYLVCPEAEANSCGERMRRVSDPSPDEGERPPSTVLEGGDTPLSEEGERPPSKMPEGGEEHRQRGVAGGPEGGERRAWRGVSRPPEHPRTPNEHVVNTPSGGSASGRGGAGGRVAAIAWTLEQLGVRANRTARLRLAAELATQRDPIEPERILDLYRYAQRVSKGNPAGLLASWLADEAKWRDVLAEVDHERKRRGQRRRPRGGVTSDPVRIDRLQVLPGGQLKHSGSSKPGDESEARDAGGGA